MGDVRVSVCSPFPLLKWKKNILKRTVVSVDSTPPNLAGEGECHLNLEFHVLAVMNDPQQLEKL